MRKYSPPEVVHVGDVRATTQLSGTTTAVGLTDPKDLRRWTVRWGHAHWIPTVH
jgi:hypothetical protein